MGELLLRKGAFKYRTCVDIGPPDEITYEEVNQSGLVMLDLGNLPSEDP